ncbi:MBL fold metallo-hydrolase [Halovenus sp. WSH3]|uniref:MBL fold metallo-hydrolase n=1 Tax=Halovenus carboxidivorans TaxID=2692199 RepID=A0A6B0TDJ5_9EURY|nr:N-acyl homoserine lactonase family protein [Halovenus carboxidivorans]MXR53000.1 MBL fold metallo-hydrolase [Halovenus carboxidivorans]
MSTVTELREFNTANWSLDNSFMEQLTDPGEPYTAVCPFYVVDHPEGVAVIDTGLSHEMLDDPASYGPYGAEFMEAFLPAIEYGPDMHPRAQLEDAGYDTSEVDYLVLTHLHSDHAGHIDTFSEAEVLVQKDELRYAHWPVPVQEVFYLEGDFDMLRSDAYDVTPIEGPYDVFGDGSLTTFPTPGHTPGHQSVQVELPETGTVILGADIAHKESGYEREHLASFNYDISQSIESLRQLKARARRENAEVFVTHDNGHIEELATGLQ